MKFLANENFPFPGIKLLRNNRYEIISISEIMPGINDKSVLRKAVDEQLIILTFDSDYGELIFKYALEIPPAVVYFRLKGTNPEHAAIMLIDCIENRKLQLNTFFTVIEENGIRQRLLV